MNVPDTAPETPGTDPAARVLAMMMAVDRELSDEEWQALEGRAAFARLGLQRGPFMALAHRCHQDLHALRGPREWLSAAEIAQFDDALAQVRDPALRLRIAGLCAAVITADGRVREPERQLYDQLLARWGLTHSRVARGILQEYRMAA